MKHLLSYALVALTTVSAVGCRDLGTGPSASLAGTYTLRTLGGQQPPATLYYHGSSDHVEILSSQLTLREDGTYSDATRVQDTHFGPTFVTAEYTEGSWLLSGSDLTLADRNDPTHVTYAFVSNGRISIDQFSGYPVTAEYVR